MKIVLFGYGKMGREIEKTALERGHEIVLKIHKDTEFSDQELAADVAIEFSQPESAVENIEKCFSVQLPVVVGTTGWYEHYKDICGQCREQNASLLTATNFSIGVNLFFQLNSQFARLMAKHPSYSPSIEETHHTEKKDAPSGTAITLAEGILRENNTFTNWEKEQSNSKDSFPILSFREENVPGTHTVKYASDIDDLEITHTAHNRKGFALGAVVAAEFIIGKKGIFNMEDVLKQK